MTETAARSFLTAEWRFLAMLNWEVERPLFQPLVPAGTELDDWNGKLYASVVGFLFLKTRILGIAVPFHADFEEVNLRFYVRRKTDGDFRRGVVFVKELVPRRLVALVARRVYHENYVAVPMAHDIGFRDDGSPCAGRVFVDPGQSRGAAPSRGRFRTPLARGRLRRGVPRGALLRIRAAAGRAHARIRRGAPAVADLAAPRRPASRPTCDRSTDDRYAVGPRPRRRTSRSSRRGRRFVSGAERGSSHDGALAVRVGPLRRRVRLLQPLGPVLEEDAREARLRDRDAPGAVDRRAARRAGRLRRRTCSTISGSSSPRRER